MSKYEIVNHEGGFAIYSNEESAFFAGYAFMGSVDWEKIPTIKCLMTKEEAEQIVSDLESADEPAEPIYPEDPQLKAVQRALDVARCRRNDAWDAYANYQKKDQFDIGGLDQAYRFYEKEQAFYEGCMFSIFAAGYSIQTQVGTDECIVTK